ncbi:MAG: methyltransferase [Gemmatimonadota bacterium]|nr:MAG: methyltransferase [Gemmatimonadota bacterium]
MKATPKSKIRDLYDSTADSYARMMDTEIDLPLYSDVLGRLAERITAIRGPVLDTSCGSGHMLFRYREQYDPERSVVGVDLSPRMVSLARRKLGSQAEILVGDMRDLGRIETASSAAVLSFFALHHLDPADIVLALEEWRRILRAGGQLVLATWEGTGAIDYGGDSDVVALRYREREIRDWVGAAGFSVSRCVVEPVEGFPMDAVYLEGTQE